ncbi:MAG: DPP IV N-terminal domain-containing protein [Chloroflexota bacterium]
MRRVVVAALAASLLIPLPAVAASPASDVTGTWFDGLVTGVCFDDAFDAAGEFDTSGSALIVPCEGPHDNEVVSRLALSDADFSSAAHIAFVDDACLAEQEAFLGRPIGSTLMFPFNVAPSEDDWAAGVHDALCVIYASEPVVGTAASGSLRAPGELIAAYREVERKPDIWLIDAGTGEALRNLTDNDLAELITAPSWTPDGASIAYAAQVDPDQPGDSDIFLLSLVDGAVEPLVEGPGGQDGAVFSPDGSTIAYISDAGADDFEIYTRDLESGEVTRLTTYADRDSSPQWSPDGSRIAFRRRTEGVSDIWLMDADGSNLERLTDNGGNNYDPRWSPDGSRIAFTTNQAGNFDIGVMNADGSQQALLTTHPADDEFPTWSSDGSVLAFHSTRQGGVSLWLMRSDGSEQSELTGLAPVGFAKFAPAPTE